LSCSYSEVKHINHCTAIFLQVVKQAMTESQAETVWMAEETHCVAWINQNDTVQENIPNKKQQPNMEGYATNF